MDIRLPLIVENALCKVHLLVLSKKNNKNYWLGPGTFLFNVSSEEQTRKIKELVSEYGSVLIANKHMFFPEQGIEFSEEHLKNGIHKVTPVKL